MKEEVTKTYINRLRNEQRNNPNYPYVYFEKNRKTLRIKIGDETFNNITPEKAIKKFGTNFYFIQEIRCLMDDSKVEEILQKKQSFKSEVIALFISFLEKNNIFDGKISLKEIKERLEHNIDAIYIVDCLYNGKIDGWYNKQYKNMYISTQNHTNEIKKAIKDGTGEIPSPIIETICHECLHAISPEGIQESEPMRAFNEGLVQYMTRQIVPEHVNNNVYWSQVNDASLLLATFGEDVIKGYLNADIEFLFTKLNEQIKHEKFAVYVALSANEFSLEYFSDEKSMQLLRQVRLKKEEAKTVFLNEIGIDIAELIKYDAPLPYGLDENMMYQAMIRYLETIEEKGIENKFGPYSKKHFLKIGLTNPDLINALINYSRRKNSGKVDLKDFLGFFDYNETNKMSEILFEDYTAFSDYCRQVANYNDDNIFVNKILLRHGINNYLADKPKLGQLVDDFFTNTSKGESYEEFIKAMLSVKNWEYYEYRNEAETANYCILNTENGTIISEDDETMFNTEKNINGKYILSAFKKDNKGNLTQIDVGLGKCIDDNTTQIDKIIKEITAKVKISDIKEVIQIMQSDTKNKDHTETLKNEGENTDNGER